jgi:hypothetical protein
MVWGKARGSAGYNVEGPVYGNYVNGVALFCFQHAPDWWICVVCGHLSTGGETRELACLRGELYARENGQRDADRHISRKQFDAIMVNPEILGSKG